MTFGNTISRLRKEKGITQEVLAQALDVTNQAVSKWESDQCCPDTMILPRIADFFDVSIDTLFGRTPVKQNDSGLPWEDDGVLRAVLFAGTRLLGAEENPCKDLCFEYEGEALNIESAFSVQCDNVRGNVSARGNVTCDEVDGNLYAGGSITCDEVNGDVYACGSIACDEINGNANALGNIRCDHIDRDFNANSAHSVHIDSVLEGDESLRQKIRSQLANAFSSDI